MVKTKQKSTLLLALAFCFAAVFILLVALKVYYEMSPKKLESPALTYVLSPTKQDLKVGETVLVPVYLTGAGAGKVSAFDIKVYYDSSKFKLVDATPGDFFSDYLTIKWDKDNAWFALALSPSREKPVTQFTSPLLTLELEAMAKSASTPVSTTASVVYVTKIGGIHPAVGTVNFKIK